MSHEFCTPDFVAEPYWWGQTRPDDAADAALPSEVDVLVVGSGYTGMHCALETAAAGHSTLVIDRGPLGAGCSTRNGGQIGSDVKPGFAELSRRFGAELGTAMVRETRGALDWLAGFIEREAIDCDFRRCGRFLAAHNPRQFRRLCRSAAEQPAGLELELKPLDAAEQRDEIVSDFYHGGLLIEHHCGLDPARYHHGLYRRARERGARFAGNCEASAIERRGDGFRVTTSRGKIDCRRLALATNGYTDALAPWQLRRVIPIGSYMLATERLPAGDAAGLMPGDRVYSDTRKLVVYFRRSPDGDRILFGGRVSIFESDPVKSLPALREEMLRIFPSLRAARISHAWMGFVAYTFDTLPHLGRESGIDYAMGYCGSGIMLASYLGHRMGRRIVDERDADSAFARIPFPTRPLYRGRPWFLAPTVRYYQWRDRLF